jgi:HAD superfamily phosphoserine phosphatase-like hydrolase
MRATDDAGRRHVDLVAFDVDGTLVRQAEGLTVWEVLNRRFLGSSEVNEQRYRMVRSGRLSYAEWVDLDIGGWREAGATKQAIVEAFESLEAVAGTRETLEQLKRRGVRRVVISGTLDLMLHTLLPAGLFDEIHANHIGFDEQGLISHWRATPFDMEGKAKALRAIALRTGVPLERCGFVGDSANDVWIARTAGRSVAFNPRCAELERSAHAVVRGNDLREILPHLLESGNG